ncbi:MAG: ABC transporter ATP-binding protein [Candidatus Eisenbacteria bacterium]|nr:ABC transporter ATP-binding protein [Candidatus Eisenbacteria bacterium]
MLRAQGLTRRYGSLLAVDHLDLHIAPGQIFGLLGPNGAGKTTTIKLMTGLLRPSEGSVQVGGHDLEKEPSAARRLIGYVADEPHLYEKLTPVEFLRFSGELYGVAADTIRGRTQRLLHLFELDGRGDFLIESLSHGMKQKVALAGALVHEPRLLFLDEPTVGLDPRGARTLKLLLRHLAGRGITIVLSTHILEIAERLCDRVAILAKGKLLATGTMAELTERMGEMSLEEIFLEMTGGNDVTDLSEALDG